MDDFGDFTSFGQFTAAEGSSMAAVDTSKGKETSIDNIDASVNTVSRRSSSDGRFEHGRLFL